MTGSDKETFFGKVLRVSIGVGFIFAVVLFVIWLYGPISLGANRSPVMAIQIEGSINPATVDYLQMAIREAQTAGASALVIELDTPGGLVSSVREMAQAIDLSKVPVIVYVTPAGASATSAGALLALSSHIAAMAPGTNIGAAHPVGSQGEDIKGTMGDKVTNDVSAFARSLAEIRGRNQELAVEIVSKSKSYSAEQAFKENIVEFVMPNLNELLKAVHGKNVKLGDAVVTLDTLEKTPQIIEMSWGQKLLHLLANPNIATILMSLGMLLIYTELSAPGGFIAGILGVISLILAFMSYQLLPIQTGGLALLVLAGLLMGAEIFVASGGALAAGGVLSFVLGILWVIDPSASSAGVSPYVWIPMAAVLAIGASGLAWLAVNLKKKSVEARTAIGGAGLLGLEGYEATVDEVGLSGRVGRVKVRGELWNFESDDQLIRGDCVKVVSQEGFTLKVSKG